MKGENIKICEDSYTKEKIKKSFIGLGCETQFIKTHLSYYQKQHSDEVLEYANKCELRHCGVRFFASPAWPTLPFYMSILET